MPQRMCSCVIWDVVRGKKNGVLKIHTPYYAVALSAYCPAKPIKFTFPKSSLSHEIAYNEQTLT